MHGSAIDGSLPRLVGLAALLAVILALVTDVLPAMAGPLEFGVPPPALPALPAVGLNGTAQTTTAEMANYTVSDATGTLAGWNVSVNGDASAGKSPVFAQYCPNVAGCGVDPQGYVGGGKSLPANSLTLNSTGATWTGVGTPPAHQCNAGCAVDSAIAVKVASAAVGAGDGTWSTTGFSPTSLSLATPTTLTVLPSEEVYRVNVVWTLISGP